MQKRRPSASCPGKLMKMNNLCSHCFSLYFVPIVMLGCQSKCCFCLNCVVPLCTLNSTPATCVFIIKPSACHLLLHYLHTTKCVMVMWMYLQLCFTCITKLWFLHLMCVLGQNNNHVIYQKKLHLQYLQNWILFLSSYLAMSMHFSFVFHCIHFLFILVHCH